MAAQGTLNQIMGQMMLYHPQEREEILDLVDKLEKLCERYGSHSSSPQLAICIVGLKIAAAKGQ